MSDEEIIRALRAGDVEPSGRFADAVMRAVRHEAAPGPIPFPWRRAAVAFVAAVAAGVVTAPMGGPAPVMPESRVPAEWLWCAGALVLSVMCAVAPVRLMSGRN